MRVAGLLLAAALFAASPGVDDKDSRERNGATGRSGREWSEPKRGAGGNRREAPAPSAKEDSRERNGATGRSGREWSEPKRGAGGNRREAPAPSAKEAFALGVLRRDGVLLPFASYDGSWSVDWPYGSVTLPISLADVPKKWWGAPGPEAQWTAWLPGEVERPLKVRNLTTVPVFCDRRLAIQTDYVDGPFEVRQPTVPKDGLATAGDVTLLPVTSVSADSPDAQELIRAITVDFNLEERLATRRFTRWEHPYKDAQRHKFPIEIEAFYRAHEKTARGEWDTTFVEAVRRFPPGEKDEGCGLITYARGWVRQQPGKRPDIDLGARITYCDREGVSFMQPFGRLILDDEVFWIYQLSSWRDEAYVVTRVRPKESRPVVAVSGGMCSR